MKSLFILAFGLGVTFVNHFDAFGKDGKSAPENLDRPTVQPSVVPEPTSKTEDIVINMEMINSFRRCYDRIEVIPWGDLMRQTNPSDWGIVYTAYRRLTFRTYNDTSTLMANLRTEICEVHKEIATSSDSVSIIHAFKFEKVIKPGKIIMIKKE
jgi:hypothetical protein